MTLLEIQALIGLVLAALSGVVCLYAAFRLRSIGRKVWHELAVGGILLLGASFALALGLLDINGEFFTLILLQPLSFALWTIIGLWALREWKEWRLLLAVRGEELNG